MAYQGIVITGVHTSGKSTIRRILSEQLGLPDLPEIADLLLHEGATLDLTSKSPKVMLPGETVAYNWDRLIMEKEIERDEAAALPSVIETAHIGNLAHALLRTPEVAGEYLSWLQNRNPRKGLIYVHLGLDTGTERGYEIMCERTRLYSPEMRPAAGQFYAALESQYSRVFSLLGLDPIRIDATMQLNDVVESCFTSLKN